MLGASSSSSLASGWSSVELDAALLIRAAQLADSSAGYTAPHPNSACIIAKGWDHVVAQSFLYAQGTDSAEVQACHAARDGARGATAYLNLEPGDCHGDDASISALKQVCIHTYMYVQRMFSSLYTHAFVCFHGRMQLGI